MDKGFLVSFEGQDACGKSELLHRVDKKLKYLGYKTRVVGEFSNSHSGEHLRNLLTVDKFLRATSNNTSSFTDSMNIISDLYYQEENEINPAINNGEIVLKERHIDSLFACEIPKIQQGYKEISHNELYEWIKNISIFIRKPLITFLLTIPTSIQIDRIKGRGESVSKEDLEIFKQRENIYNKVAEENSKRIIIFDNNKTPELATEQIVSYLLKSFRKQEYN